ncbi:MAG: TolB family protein [Candidatus Cryptobacteroides sp.]
MRKIQFVVLSFLFLKGLFLNGQVLSIQNDTLVQKDTLVSNEALRMFQKADSLRKNYDFLSAITLLHQSEDKADSLLIPKIKEQLLQNENALSMMDYCSHPVVVSKRKFSIKDFYLFYPLEDKSWRPLPNILDTATANLFVNATYIPNSSKSVHYSALDSTGSRNLYYSEYIDTLWSQPKLVNKQITSSSDEIYPMLSPDGTKLYFSSKGLYGMGGYDLYVSEFNKNTKEWGTPVNMGFPYSSPADDFLFINTEDEKYSIFASNRETSSDSVCVYVLEYETTPVRKALKDIKLLRNLAFLTPVNDPSRIDNVSAIVEDIPENEETKKYMDKILEVRQLRDTLTSFNRHLEELRATVSSIEEQEKKQDVIDTILIMERQFPFLQDSLKRAGEELHNIEMEFLINGIVIDPDKIQVEVEKEIVGVTSGYTYTKNQMGENLVNK